MKFPELPSDNLYKFIAFAGMTIIILSFVPLYYAHKLKLDTIDMKEKIENLEIQQKWLNQDIKQFVDDIRKLEEQALKEKMPEIQAKQREFLEANRKKENALIHIKSQVEKLDYLIKLHWKESVAGVIGSMVGFFLTILGFILWYTKLQKHQDEIIKKEAITKVETKAQGEEKLEAYEWVMIDAEKKAKKRSKLAIEARLKTEREARDESEEKARAYGEAIARAEEIARSEAEHRAKAEVKARAEVEEKVKSLEQARLEAEKRAEVETKARTEAQKQARLAIEAIEAKSKAEKERKARSETKAKDKTRIKTIAETRAKRKAKAEAMAKAISGANPYEIVDISIKTGTCECCGRKDVLENQLHKIDSGQFCCPGCLIALRSS